MPVFLLVPATLWWIFPACLSPFIWFFLLLGAPFFPPFSLTRSLSSLVCTTVSTSLRDPHGSIRTVRIFSLVGDLVQALEEIAQWLLS